MLNHIEKLSLRTRILSGLLSGLSYASGMALFDYYEGKSFHLVKFLFHAFFFGIIMSFVFRHKVTKKKDN